MGQNLSRVPAKKLFVSDFLESPRNYCPSEPLLIPLREERLYYDEFSVYRGSNFQPFTAHANTQLRGCSHGLAVFRSVFWNFTMRKL